MYAATNISSSLEKAYIQLENEIDLFQRNGSGWVLEHVDTLDLTLWELDPLRGSSYHQIPEWIQVKIAVVNVRNTEQD